MKAQRLLGILTMAVMLATTSASQTKIIIPAGTPEDKALNEITNENDQAKRIAMLEEFVKTYSGNKAALAYGYWQLSQQYSVTDQAKALEYGDQALAAMPEVLDIIQSQTDLAQQSKNPAKVVDYAVRGAKVFKGIDKQFKPEGVSDDDFATRIKNEKAEAQPVYEYLQMAAYNAVVTENDAKRRMPLIEKFTEGFAGSKWADQANVLAVATLQELNDMSRLTSFGEKALASDPNNLQLLMLMANAYAEDPKGANLEKANTYAKKVIELAKADTAGTPESKQINEGFAHAILGYSLLRQEKTALAIPELKTAATMVKSDQAKYSVAMFRLGYAYAKANRVAEAKQTLTEAANTPGPFKDAAKDMLQRISAVKPAAKK